MHHPLQATIDSQLEQFAVQKVQHWTFLPIDALSNPHQSLSSPGFKHFEIVSFAFKAINDAYFNLSLFSETIHTRMKILIDTLCYLIYLKMKAAPQYNEGHSLK